MRTPERGDIWFLCLDPVKGREMEGNRRVMVVSTKEFNETTKLSVVVPITTGNATTARIHGMAVSLMNVGLKTVGVVACYQPRAVDFSQRDTRYIETAPDYVIDEVMAKVASIFEG